MAKASRGRPIARLVLSARSGPIWSGKSVAIVSPDRCPSDVASSCDVRTAYPASRSPSLVCTSIRLASGGDAF